MTVTRPSTRYSLAWGKIYSSLKSSRKSDLIFRDFDEGGGKQLWLNLLKVLTTLNKIKDLDLAAQNIIYNILVLSSSPTFARNILVVDNYGRGKKTPAGESFKQQVFSGLQAVRSMGLNVAFVDFANIWNGVLGFSPGFKAFGYTNPGACAVNSETTVGACSDPDHSFYWIPG